MKHGLALLFLIASLAQPALAQSDELKQRFERSLSESSQMFGARDYENGANRILQAASIVKAMPEKFSGYSAPTMLSTAIEFLDKECATAKSRGDEDTYERASGAREGLVRSLNSWKQPHSGGNSTAPVSSRFNPYVPNQSGPTIGGTNGRYSNTGPGSGAQYHPVHITPDSLRSGKWGPGLGRARVDWSRLPLPRAGGGNGSQGTNCPNCGTTCLLA